MKIPLPSIAACRTWLLLAGACALAACGHARPDEPATAAQGPAQVVLHFSAIASLNPGPEGQPTPVRVRVFELRNAGRFRGADYFALVEQPGQALGDDLVDRDELLVQPGEQRDLVRRVNPATRQLGIVVGYRALDRAQWRDVIELPADGRGDYQISLDVHAIRSAPALTP
ncbi:MULTISPECIES: type VI secretion system lipoprotein TssJ [unclassified Pseudomonas]|uniref:type VI secretion system lipoprotein TssJ n=1 Tax=unclassified Pseudomonas TaxID=196821 RepID=UPI000BCBC3A9|nr:MULTISPECIES: type VI secretion system lipoprotein TssJ [unclassified Pseudomonas]PVZ09741.1 type VI secretion system protein VasD [Pseudomonas sp. URIL14HWK12:I12]PVZ21503.1 type VI secretion system protein VasD [Pseudomonas sp. URIL14HWK12:I10]PVZ30316.1 type VI secretion system protein VasD [Pseudomonas sp. URIL14HWK12:I11]SNZ18613.1 type VI secretion system protein VasD [Pseudomonas sp. URIL14HWK12:I9]